MPEYTLVGLVAVALVVGLERFRWHSGIFRNRSYWIAMAICLFFMVLVNGWLTKLSAPIVEYDPVAKTPWRFPWDIPVEDYLFGFALLTAVVARWEIRADAHLESETCPDQSPSLSPPSRSS